MLRNLILIVISIAFSWWFFTAVKDIRETTDTTRVADCTGQGRPVVSLDEWLWQYEF